MYIEIVHIGRKSSAYQSIIGETFSRCTLCSSDFNISHGGKNDVTAHVNTTKHKDMLKASKSKPVSSFFRPQIQQSTIKAETMWSVFVAKHNLAILTSDHATKMFREMFPDSEIAKKFACGRTKTSAIVKEALAPYYHKKTIDKVSNPFSILMANPMTRLTSRALYLSAFLTLKLGK